MTKKLSIVVFIVLFFNWIMAQNQANSEKQTKNNIESEQKKPAEKKVVSPRPKTLDFSGAHNRNYEKPTGFRLV